MQFVGTAVGAHVGTATIRAIAQDTASISTRASASGAGLRGGEGGEEGEGDDEKRAHCPSKKE